MSDRPDCDNHAATVTAPLYVVHGQARYATEPVTMCVTCHAIVSDGQRAPMPKLTAALIEESR